MMSSISYLQGLVVWRIFDLEVEYTVATHYYSLNNFENSFV